MIAYFFHSIISTITILFLAKFIKINQKFTYFAAILILCLLTLINLILGFLYPILIIKIFLIIYGIYKFLNKEINFNSLDLLFIFGCAVLIFYNFGDIFRKTDIVNGYGLLSKSIHQYFQLPQFNLKTNYLNFNIDIFGNIFYSYFYAGIKNFREDIVILSHNIFCLSCFFSLANKKNLKEKKIYFLLFFLFLIFLTNIFGFGGKLPFNEEITIFSCIYMTIFLIENRNKLSKIQFTIFIILFFFLGSLSKLTTYFLYLIPIYYLFFLEKNKLHKFITPILCIIIFVFTAYTMKVINKQRSVINQGNSVIDILSTFDEKKQIISDESRSFKLILYNLNKNFNLTNIGHIFFHDRDIYQRFQARSNYLKESEKGKDKIKEILDKIFFMEVYKASFFALPTYFINLYDEDFRSKTSKIRSLNILVWAFIILLTYIYFHKKIKKTVNKKIINNFYLIISITIFLVIILCIEDTLRFNEKLIINSNINFISSEYSLPDRIIVRDVARYLGWPLYYFFPVLIYLSHKFLKSEIKLLKYIVILFLIVAPARTYGYWLKMDHNQWDYKFKESLNKEFSKKFLNKCSSKKYNLAIGYHYETWDFHTIRLHDLNYNLLIYSMSKDKIKNTIL